MYDTPAGTQTPVAKWQPHLKQSGAYGIPAANNTTERYGYGPYPAGAFPPSSSDPPHRVAFDGPCSGRLYHETQEKRQEHRIYSRSSNIDLSKFPDNEQQVPPTPTRVSKESIEKARQDAHRPSSSMRSAADDLSSGQTLFLDASLQAVRGLPAMRHGQQQPMAMQQDIEGKLCITEEARQPHTNDKTYAPTKMDNYLYHQERPQPLAVDNGSRASMPRLHTRITPQDRQRVADAAAAGAPSGKSDGIPFSGMDGSRRCEAPLTEPIGSPANGYWNNPAPAERSAGLHNFCAVTSPYRGDGSSSTVASSTFGSAPKMSPVPRVTFEHPIFAPRQ